MKDRIHVDMRPSTSHGQPTHPAIYLPTRYVGQGMLCSSLTARPTALYEDEGSNNFPNSHSSDSYHQMQFRSLAVSNLELIRDHERQAKVCISRCWLCDVGDLVLLDSQSRSLEV